METQQNQSEIAQFLEQWEQEVEAIRQGLKGFAITARHEFINRRIQAFGDERIMALMTLEVQKAAQNRAFSHEGRSKMTENERKRSEERIDDERTAGADQKESEEVDARMEPQSSSADEPLDWDELMTFSLEELEELLLHLYAALGAAFHEISGYAQGATQIQAQFEKLVGLEKHYKKIWEDLKVTVNAIIGHVFFSDRLEEDWKKLARVLHEDMAFLQAVTSGSEITSQWLAERDALVAQTASVVSDVREEAVRQCEKEKKGAFLLLLQDIGIMPMWHPSNSGRSPRP